MIRILIILACLLNFSANAQTVPLTAQAWLVADSNGKIIEGSNMTEIRSIASITKLMTAMVALDHDKNMDEKKKRKESRKKCK